MTTSPRFIMIGGFLGAGKTTTIARLAQHFQSQGKKVGIVTNDQATDLVDTSLLRTKGFDVGEVAGSCFCCNFNALTDTVEKLGDGERPDVIIAEPVGSCTDLVATVIRPLQKIYEQPIDVAPFGVIVKPSHGTKILKKVTKGGFSPQAEYIFRKQLEEADFILINRIDELSLEQVDELESLLRVDFPTTPVVRISAKSGEGFESFFEALDQRGDIGTRDMDVDYDIYAEGEAELGWLNAQLDLSSPSTFAIDNFLLSVLDQVKKRCVDATYDDESGEIAHLKGIGMSQGRFAVANLVSNDSNVVLSMPSNAEVSNAEVVINARIAVAPESLERIVTDAVGDVSSRLGLNHEIRTLQCFRPGRPVPTHRYAQES